MDIVKQQLIESCSKNDLEAFGEITAVIEQFDETSQAMIINHASLPQNNTSLHLASICGNTTMISWLLKHRAKADALNNGQQTPLMLACVHNHTQAAALLLDAGADVNARDLDSFTPLIRAILNPNVTQTFLDLLLDAGANIFSRDLRGWTPLHIAIRSTRMNLVRIILKHDPPSNAQNETGETPLFHAVSLGLSNAVAILLEHGDIDVDLENYAHETPLSKACDLRNQKVSMKICQLLLDNGADIKKSSNILINCAISQNTPLLKYLLQKGADINGRNKHGQTILLLSAQGTVKYRPKFLLEHGADVNIADNEGQTPLLALFQTWRYAQKVRNVLTIGNLLLDHGADVSFKCNHVSTTPLHTCLNRIDSLEFSALAIRLLDKGADINFQLPYSLVTPVMTLLDRLPVFSIPDCDVRQNLIRRLMTHPELDFHLRPTHYLTSEPRTFFDFLQRAAEFHQILLEYFFFQRAFNEDDCDFVLRDCHRLKFYDGIMCCIEGLGSQADIVEDGMEDTTFRSQLYQNSLPSNYATVQTNLLCLRLFTITHRLDASFNKANVLYQVMNDGHFIM